MPKTTFSGKYSGAIAKAGRTGKDHRQRELLAVLDDDFVAIQHAQLVQGIASTGKTRKKPIKPVTKQELDHSVDQLCSLLIINDT